MLLSSICIGAMGRAAETSHIAADRPMAGRTRCRLFSRRTSSQARVAQDGLGATSRAMAQMKAASSRAMAVATTVDFLPLRDSLRNRLHSRTWAFQAISRAGLGAAETNTCFSYPTRGG